MENKQILYSNRFDSDYLSHLLEELTIESLKKSALSESKVINDVEYHKCINIDFCGHAATTLFFTNLNNEEITGKKFELRRKVSTTFKKIFQRDELLKLNNGNPKERFYLRVRFCFSYLFSDYPICLMKAEQKDVWANLGDKPIDDYYISKPLSNDEFKNSEIRSSQENSLNEIVQILKDNDDLIILGGQEKKVNTIQVRFASIPSPICTLIINNTAYCDPYLYAKLGTNRHLSLNYPLLVMRENDETMPKAFESIRKHVNYLWRHDLTLFCSDATKFKPGEKDGLTTLLSPELITNVNGTNWSHKEKRIWEKKEETAKRKLIKTISDLEIISNWKSNLNRKLKMCTRKIGDLNSNANEEPEVVVGMKGKFYFFFYSFS